MTIPHKRELQMCFNEAVRGMMNDENPQSGLDASSRLQCLLRNTREGN